MIQWQKMGYHARRLSRLLLLVVLAAGCASTPAQQPATSNPPGAPDAADAPEVTDISMRLQWIPQYQFAGYIVAEMKGYYEEAGLNVELLPGSPDFVPLPLVASGSDTFGSTGADTILLARQRDIPVVALATWFQTSPVGFMVHSDAGITTPQDFVGKTVAVSYGDNVETEYRALLAVAEVERSQIDEVPLQVNMEPFLSRRVDVWPVYITDQPHQARQQGAEVELILARDYGVQLMGDVLFTTEEFIAQHPNTTRAFVHATLRGWHDAIHNLDETIELVAEYNQQLTPDHLRFEGQETIELLQYGAGAACPGWNDRTMWAAEQQMLQDIGILESAIPVANALDNRFVADYYQKRGIACPEE